MQLLIRIKVDDKNSVCKFSKKFGVEQNEVEDLLKYAKNLNLNVTGVCFHVGSGCYDATQYYRALEQSREVFNIAKKVGYKFSMLDIGGGFPGYRDDDSQQLIANISEQVRLGVTDFFSNDYYIEGYHGDSDEAKPFLKIIAEPGRFFVQSSHTLLVNVIGRKVKNTPDSKTFCYYMNDGIYGSFNCIYFDHQKPEILPYNERDGESYDSVVFGPTCDSMDTVCEGIQLPELAIGEWCFIKNFGAYTVAAATDFNGFSKLRAFYILN